MEQWLAFSKSSYEVEYMRYVAQVGLKPSLWKLVLCFAAVVIALLKVLLLLDYGALRLQAISAALLLAGLAIGYLAAITSALRNEAWFVCHHEHIKLALEVAAAFTLFWWMLVLHPSQLTPTQTPFNIMVFRGYGMILDRMRLTSTVPLLIVETAVLAWMELHIRPGFVSVLLVLNHILLGVVTPLLIMAVLETRQRWHFIQYRTLGLQGLGPWPPIIDRYLYTLHMMKGVAGWLQTSIAQAYGMTTAICTGVASVIVGTLVR
eukprot:jgi/Chrzof1/11965/Cz06g16100.t1